jgi:hypothetical protein
MMCVCPVWCIVARQGAQSQQQLLGTWAVLGAYLLFLMLTASSGCACWAAAHAAADLVALVGSCCSIFPLTDPKGLKQVLEQILDADWDAVIMAHGTPVLSGGHQALRDGTYAWVSRIVERRGRPWVVKVGMPLLKVVGVAVLGVAVAGQVKRIRKQQGGSK